MSELNVTKASGLSPPTTDNADNICVVCFRDVDIYSIGECDHPVCYECSTRMRVLCKQFECPICRQALGKVVFTRDKLTYREVESRNRSELFNAKYKISFYSRAIQQAFYHLLDHPCPRCDRVVFRQFAALRDHVRREHDLYYCDLCTDNLKIFSFERRCYTKSELSMHRRIGDPDNTSHRGHPLCEYCDTRYLDRDELFRHLRRDHYFCHFCDADGCNEFYKDYAALREHFRSDHYLCEEGRCALEEFVGAFRTDIDFKAHVANVHGKTLNKQQAKQTRTLQLEITLGPRGRNGQTEPHIANLRSRRPEDNEEQHFEPPPSPPYQRVQPIDACNEQEFPSLGGAAPAPLNLMRPPPLSMRSRSVSLARTKENFPALGSSGGAHTMNGAHTIASAVAGAANPTVSTPSSTKRPNQASISSLLKKNTSAKPEGSMLIHVSNRPGPSTGVVKKINPSNKNDFPALPGTSKNPAQMALQEDFIPPGSSQQFNIATKHRTLVDDYVSVANPSNFTKIKLVQKEAEDAKTKKPPNNINAPKLDLLDFPALSIKSKPSTSNPPNWGKSQKQRELDNRKSKVAAAPVLQANSKQKNSKPTNGSNNSLVVHENKKDKKIKNLGNEVKKQTESEKQNEKKNNHNDKKSTSKKEAALTNGTLIQSIDNNENDFVSRIINPPPGFTSRIVKPPPGFQDVTLNSIAKSPNNLIFTNSLGESYNIVPTHSYIQPSESCTRNQNLIRIFKDALGTAEALEEFRKISLIFREGAYKPHAYYDHCRAALKDQFDVVFPELLSLLPDISKQQSLFLVHSQRLNSLPNAQNKLLPKLEVCSTCKQVLLSKDLDNHQELHAMRDAFPTLGDDETKSNGITNKRK